MNEATIREMFSDEVFLKGLFQLETPEEVQMALRQKDISLSVEEIVKVRELMLKRLETGAELSEEELAEVTGGSVTVIAGLIILVGAATLLGATSLGGIAYCTNVLTHGRW
jgi:lactobin A/cerein 7B family class IIb bacteriocin